VPDAKEVAYFSVVGSTRFLRTNPLLWPSHLFLSARAGPNDGIVPAASQRWGKVLHEVERITGPGRMVAPLRRGALYERNPARDLAALRFLSGRAASEAAPHRRHGRIVARPSAQQGGAWTISAPASRSCGALSISFIEAARTPGRLRTHRMASSPVLRSTRTASARPRSAGKGAPASHQPQAHAAPGRSGSAPTPAVAPRCVPADAHVHHSREETGAGPA